MKQILLIGAGKSANALIEYLRRLSDEKGWRVMVTDASKKILEEKVGNTNPNMHYLVLDIHNNIMRKSIIAASDIVISMMPPDLHFLIAEDCIKYKKHLLTASYIDERLKALAKDVKQHQLLFLCEMGLDPGIDHMSAMELIHRIKQQGGIIDSFYSHCGGLVAPESDNNPWRYKISWNPRNVVLAGKAGAVYKWKNEVVNKTYEEVFAQTAAVYIDGIGNLCYYPNRDSLSYIDLYDVTTCQSFIRTTLRYPAFCSGWHFLIQYGFTEDTNAIDTTHMRVKDFFTTQLEKFHIGINDIRDNQQLYHQLVFLGLEDNTLIHRGVCSNAAILQWLLETKLMLMPTDKDMIVMQHEIGYTLNGVKKKITTEMVVTGDNSFQTAMSKTVGLPLGIAAKLILEGNISLSGLMIPIYKEIYEPVLAALVEAGIQFKEREEILL